MLNIPRSFYHAAGVIASGALAVSCGVVFAAEEKNSAFLFIKPHANTPAAQALVKKTLEERGIKITAEGELSGPEIDKRMLIDQHYYSIASRATLLKPAAMPVPADKFEAGFGVKWSDVLKEGNVYNAMDACTVLGVDAAGMDALWAKAKKVKLGGGFYCGLVSTPSKPNPIYVFNGFFMEMRSKFVQPGTSIHYYVVSFDPASLPWADFRGKVLGPTDPSQAPEGALRGTILRDWQALGLKAVPNVGDNGVHASASPFEGLAERMNWLGVSVEEDAFGARLLKAGVSAKTVKEWSLDPQVGGKSLFDQVEDLDADQCVAKLAALK